MNGSTHSNFNLGESARVVPNGHAIELARKQRRTATRQRCDYVVLKRLIEEIYQRTNKSDHDILNMLGQSGSSNLSDWRDKGAPTTVVLAAKWVAHTFGIREVTPIKMQFDNANCCKILGAILRLPPSDPERASLISMLAKEVAAFTE